MLFHKILGGLFLKLLFIRIKHISISLNLRKNYFSSTNETESTEETAEYIDSRGMLVKGLHYDVATRILHECQIWDVDADEGTTTASRPKLKAQNTAVTYFSKFWHKESNRVRDPAEVPNIT